MKILFDICHPAHVHFFKNTWDLLARSGHEIIICARDKECTLSLLDTLPYPYIPLNVKRGKGPVSFLKELIARNHALYKVVKKTKPDKLAAVGGTFVAHVGYVSRTPSIVFYDGDNATLQNAITYPFSTHLILPESYTATFPKKKTIQYRGFHEGAYLHPNYFTPNKEIALKNGWIETKENFLIRATGNEANHDMFQKGIDIPLLEKLVYLLSDKGNVIISSERPLPSEFSPYLYQGTPDALHHLMAHCRAFIGESPTMASECAQLGVPSLYVSNIVCGNTTALDTQFGLVSCHPDSTSEQIIEGVQQMLAKDIKFYQNIHAKLLHDTVDVTQFITKCVNEL